MLKDKLEKLFDLAANNLNNSEVMGSYTKGKSFELYTLFLILKKYKDSDYLVEAVPPTKLGNANELYFAGSPSKVDKGRYSHFDLEMNKKTVYEAWVSAEVITRSAVHSRKLIAQKLSQLGWLPSLKKNFPASCHEVDVAVFTPLNNGPYRPEYTQLVFLASCKHTTKFKKEYLREALGLRLETATNCHPPRKSLAPMFTKHMPVDPASPLYLFSTDIICNRYRVPVDSQGVFVRHLRFS